METNLERLLLRKGKRTFLKLEQLNSSTASPPQEANLAVILTKGTSNSLEMAGQTAGLLPYPTEYYSAELISTFGASSGIVEIFYYRED